jgi:hypothetical protein
MCRLPSDERLKRTDGSGHEGHKEHKVGEAKNIQVVFFVIFVCFVIFVFAAVGRFSPSVVFPPACVSRAARLFCKTCVQPQRAASQISLQVALSLVLILRSALVQVGAGLAIGLPAAFIMGRVLQARLFDVTPYDPLVICGGLALLACFAGIAALLPAGRAARMDPCRALRVD